MTGACQLRDKAIDSLAAPLLPSQAVPAGVDATLGALAE